MFKYVLRGPIRHGALGIIQCFRLYSAAAVDSLRTVPPGDQLATVNVNLHVCCPCLEDEEEGR